MSNKKSNYVKVLFRYYSNVLDETVAETMWATKINEKNGIYKLDSIPFYGPQIATEDEFFAEFDDLENMLTYRKTTKNSGNSIILISITSKDFNTESILNEFKILNCSLESLNESYLSMEVLILADYSIIKQKLENYESQKILAYAEPCLSEKHRKDIN